MDNRTKHQAVKVSPGGSLRGEGSKSCGEGRGVGASMHRFLGPHHQPQGGEGRQGGKAG